jgi:hypothetical protein
MTMEPMNVRRAASREELLRGTRLAVDAAITAAAQGTRVEPHLVAAQYFLGLLGSIPDERCCRDTGDRSA